MTLYGEYMTSQVCPNPVSNTRVSRTGHCGLWVMVTCPHRFTNGKKRPTLVAEMGRGEGCVSVGARNIWDFSAPSPQFCSVPKTALKKKKKAFV